MIEVQGVSKTYMVSGQKFTATDNVTLRVERGESVAIVGHSGSGKTTLLSMMGGLTRPNSGVVRIADIDIWAMNDNQRSEFRNRTISFIYQFASLIPTLTALENILLPAAFGDNQEEDLEKKAKDLLARVGLQDKMNYVPSQLSGGQQRRVAIARAFINNPQILLADEPTGDLDEETEKDIMQLFQTMKKDLGTTSVIVTHEQQIAACADRLLHMKDGRMVD